jgi:preprotein translocase subunit SecA
MYKKLAGMTGTAATSAEEFDKVYGLEVMIIPTNKPMIRGDLSDRIYKTEKGKFEAIIKEIKAKFKMNPTITGKSQKSQGNTKSLIESYQVLNLKKIGDIFLPTELLFLATAPGCRKSF